ncbi:hypothetical protein DPMN_098444 [Dreissena polymorpha]|uniref:Uncharacterized protein n=1 Tax=Dreissena polymorpha TaxID=45954 RepID=A0A9D4R799_DREPO|nr:hypothetical protein DPMN_098444 [Dreissena polymorpha]
MKNCAKDFLNASEISAQEAVYLLQNSVCCSRPSREMCNFPEAIILHSLFRGQRWRCVSEEPDTQVFCKTICTRRHMFVCQYTKMRVVMKMNHKKEIQ